MFAIYEARGLNTKKLFAKGATKSEVSRKLVDKYSEKVTIVRDPSHFYPEPLIIVKGAD